jgi:hypothetical protein
LGVIAGADQQPRLDLLKNSHRKIRRRGIIHGDGDNAAIGTAQKCRNPCGRIRPPDHDAIALANSAGGKFAGEPECQAGYVAITPAYKPVADPLGIGLFTAEALKVCQIIGDAGSHRLSVNHLTRAGWLSHAGDLLDETFRETQLVASWAVWARCEQHLYVSMGCGTFQRSSNLPPSATR